MAQNLLSTSLEKFVLILPTMSDRSLMDLYESIYQWQRNEGDNIGLTIPIETLHNMLRKAAEIELELYNRGLIQKVGSRSDDYNRWAKRVHTQLKRKLI